MKKQSIAWLFLALLAQQTARVVGGNQNTRLDKTIADHKILRVLKEQDFPSCHFHAPDVIFEQGGGVYWIAGTLGFCRFDETTSSMSSYKDHHFFAQVFPAEMVRDSGDDIWLAGVIHRDLRRLDDDTWKTVELNTQLKRKVSVYSMAVDKSGVLWLATDAGLLSHDRKSWGALITPPLAECKTYDRFWRRYPKDMEVMAEREGLFRKEASAHDDAAGQVLRARVASELRKIAEGGPRELWIGAERGIFRVNLPSNSWRVYPLPGELTEIHKAYRDRSGRMWFCDGGPNIAVYDPRSEKWDAFNLVKTFPEFSPDNINTIYQERGGAMWFGTIRGLAALDSNGAWRFYSYKNSALPGYEVTAISQDQAGRIWMGTSEGIVLLAQ